MSLENKNVYDVAIIDGQNVFYKSFSTQGELSVLIGFKEVKTGGTFGFIQTLINIKSNYLKPDGKIFVAWDRGYKRRTAIYPEYKKNRGDKSEWDEYENFKAQREMLQEVLSILGVCQVYKDGEEADDIAGTLSYTKAEAGQKVIIMSADKDYQQLIREGVDLYAHKSASNIKLWNEENWEKEYGFHPSNFTYILALSGDAGDNIPGVSGIGDKGAHKLVKENFKLLKSILMKDINSDLIPQKPSSAIQKLIDQQDLFRLSYDLALIDRNIRGMKMKKGKKDMEALENIFAKYQFNKLLQSANWKILEEM